MNRCPVCGGTMNEDSITHPQEYAGRIILLENVPVLACGQCGEVLIKPAVLERIQKLAWSESEPKRTASIPVYDMAEAI